MRFELTDCSLLVCEGRNANAVHAFRLCDYVRLADTLNNSFDRPLLQVRCALLSRCCQSAPRSTSRLLASPQEEERGVCCSSQLLPEGKGHALGKEATAPKRSHASTGVRKGNPNTQPFHPADTGHSNITQNLHALPLTSHSSLIPPGTCDIYTSRCTCPPGYGGRLCEQLLYPACRHTEKPGPNGEPPAMSCTFQGALTERPRQTRCSVSSKAIVAESFRRKPWRGRASQFRQPGWSAD